MLSTMMRSWTRTCELEFTVLEIKCAKYTISPRIEKRSAVANHGIELLCRVWSRQNNHHMKFRGLRTRNVLRLAVYPGLEGQQGGYRHCFCF